MRWLALVALLLPACSNGAVSTLAGPGDDDDAPAAAPKATTEIAATTPAAAPKTVAPPSTCAPLGACDAPALNVETRTWNHPATSSVVVHMGEPHHRVRDMLFTPGEQQRVHAKFTYGPADKDLHGETIDLFVQRDCASGWEKLGEATTTEDGEHATVDGVEDSGGRIYFDVPAGKELGPGRHRVRAVVAGDGTFADGFLDVVPAGTPIVVSDVDGTLTSSETVVVQDTVTGAIPETHEGAPEAFQTLAKKGYRMMYLTARPEALTQATRDFLALRGFPPGIVHTTSATAGVMPGSGAATFKSDELALVKGKGFVTAFGFGNMPSDSDAYATVVADPQRRIFYRIDGAFTGRRIDSYTELLTEFQKLAPVCE